MHKKLKSFPLQIYTFSIKNKTVKLFLQCLTVCVFAAVVVCTGCCAASRGYKPPKYRVRVRKLLPARQHTPHQQETLTSKHTPFEQGTGIHTPFEQYFTSKPPISHFALSFLLHSISKNKYHFLHLKYLFVLLV